MGKGEGLSRMVVGAGAGIAVMMFVCLAVLTVTASAASGAFTIRDNSTGGDCTSIGTWDNSSRTCTLNQDINGTIGIVDTGIILDGAGHTLSGPGMDGGLVFNDSNVVVENLTVTGFDYGIQVTGGQNNILKRDTLTGNSVGIVIDGSNGNTITCNIISGNGEGLVLVYGSAGNTVSSNDFTGNGTQADDQSGATNSFNLAAPNGGNYWSDYAGADSDQDGIGDTPYVNTKGVTDNRPWMTADGWDAIKPDLRLFDDGSNWASFADYTSNDLQVKFHVHDNGVNATNVVITGATVPAGGASLITAVPVSLGDISTGSSASFTLDFHVAASVSSFIVDLTGSAGSCCSAGFTYP